MTDKRFSGRIGEEYNLWAKAVPHHERMQQRVAQYLWMYLADKPFAHDIIELGCGTGYTTQTLLATDPQWRVFAVDNEPVMLQQAKASLTAEITSGRACFILADILAYLNHQETQTQQSIVSAMTIHNFDAAYRTSVLERIYQDLVWGGIFINADKYALDDAHAHHTTLGRQLEQFQKVAREEGVPEFAKERTEHYLRDNEPDLLMKQQEAIDEMKKIGFKDIQIIFREQMEAILVARK